MAGQQVETLVDVAEHGISADAEPDGEGVRVGCRSLAGRDGASSAESSTAATPAARHAPPPPAARRGVGLQAAINSKWPRSTAAGSGMEGWDMGHGPELHSGQGPVGARGRRCHLLLCQAARVRPAVWSWSRA